MTKSTALMAALLAVCTVSTTALAVTGRTAATAERDVKQLMHLMDVDKNGVVTKEEFLNYMGRTFDRLDLNKSGMLERDEMHQMATQKWLIEDCVHVPFPQCSN